MNKIAFLGAGNMASALATGIINKKIAEPNNIILFDKYTEQYKKFDSACLKADSIVNAVNDANYIVLSVKPQNVKEVVSEIKGANYKNKVFISICAGTPISLIEDILPGAKVVRTMPNTPLLIGQGVTAICKNNKVTDSEFAYATSLFECSGYVSVMDEGDLCAITAVNGSSPAYFYLFAKSMLDAAHNLGLKGEDLLEIICKTMIGSANMILSSGKSPDELIQMVKSPNGTTERALNVFENESFPAIIDKAMKECTERAIELSKLD